MDRLAAMEVFARVAASGSFSAAARELGLSKSAVSKQVRALEDRLGARLINRTTRRLSLTEVGRAYQDWCQRILGQIAEAEAVASSLHGEPRGRLRVDAPTSLGIDHLAPLLPAFLTRHPRISIDLTLNDRYVDVVEEGYDVVVRIRAGQLADSSLIARRLAPARQVVCASPDYLRRAGTPRVPEDLAGHDCLSYSYRTMAEEWRLVGPGGETSVEVRGSLQANNGDALRVAAVAGLGLVVSPTFIVGEDLRAGRLVRVLPEWSGVEGAIYAVYPHSRHLSAKVQAFVAFLAERLGPEPPWDAPWDAR